ncbi:hypothetical protein TVAG_492960 [Trichomonas vaginalis G3]|uniref:Uncharacterized protein n=1 Tax=Trichomonas vaginalis (strain ATCC PRA-98 / G3) TaxID=412133 RepID=A2FUT9_TRIV3|nr:hypothetical protein TVAGG3_0155970 [Trichomonas vaginalis G3]EAX91328.1 hypothetical protein TVAG_492960 [Trichomonas vaginalis G3]KAI5547562.1 hypothetical protein TVAGG3_0155970 [Trichomonas vaginalis G3]|eukprot:XP_001304258.1 hypothetical protein [Trichomonas vaginalis G3]
MSNQLEPMTKELLSRDKEEIYSVLVRLKESLQEKPEAVKSSLLSSPEFMRAIYQAQIEFDCFVTEVPHAQQ